MEFHNPQQPNNQPPAPGSVPPQQPNPSGAQPTPTNTPTPPQAPQGTMGNNMTNMQNSPLFTDSAPEKKSNTAIIILVIVIVLVIAAGVVFFLMSDRGPQVEGTPVVDENGQVQNPFGEQQASNRDLNSEADITAELGDLTSEIEQLNIDDFEQEFSEIDDLLNDINF